MTSKNHGQEAFGRNDKQGRESTGIQFLDGLTRGGFLSGKTYLVTGMPATGKTVFALQFLMAGLAAGERGVFVCASQRPEDLIDAAESLGWKLRQAVASGKALILDLSPYFSRFNPVSSVRDDGRWRTLSTSKLAAGLARHVRELGATRVVIDSATPLLPTADRPEAAVFSRELVISMEQHLGCTSLLVLDYWQGSGLVRVHPLESYVAGVINLRLVERGGEMIRNLLVKKMAATAVPRYLYRFEIEALQGIGPFLVAADEEPAIAVRGRFVDASEEGLPPVSKKTFS